MFKNSLIGVIQLRMSAYETYCLFLALKNHFTTKSYDYFKYSGKTNASQDSFMSRKDRFHYQRLCRKCTDDQMKDYIISNLIKGKLWVGDLLDDEAEQNYKEYTKRKQAFTYQFSNEIDKLFSSVKIPSEVFDIKKNQYPIILNKYLSGELCIEFFCVLNNLIQFVDKFNDKIGTDDVIWSKISLLIVKLHPFLEYDRKKIIGALKSKLYT